MHGGSKKDDKGAITNSSGSNWDPDTWNGFTQRVTNLAASECPLQQELTVEVNNITVNKLLRREFIL